MRVCVEQLQQHLRAAAAFQPGRVELTADLRRELGVSEQQHEHRFNDG